MREQEKVLFDEWKLKRPKLITDGVVNEKKYNDSTLKVLYILKEANGGKGWDLRKLLGDGGHASTWNNIARWQYGINNYQNEISWDNVKNIDQKFRKEQLETSAVINLKKDSGGSSANSKEIWTYAWDDKDFLKKQIAIYNPDIIICCGTGEIVRERELIDKWGKDKWEKSSREVKYHIKEVGDKKQIIISFCHPAIRSNAKDKFNQLVKTIQEIIL